MASKLRFTSEPRTGFQLPLFRMPRLMMESDTWFIHSLVHSAIVMEYLLRTTHLLGTGNTEADRRNNVFVLMKCTFYKRDTDIIYRN